MKKVSKSLLIAVLAGSALMAGSANAWFGNWWPGNNGWGSPWGGYPGYGGRYPGYGYGAYPYTYPTTPAPAVPETPAPASE